MSILSKDEALRGRHRNARTAAMRKPKAPEANRARILKAAIDQERSFDLP